MAPCERSIIRVVIQRNILPAAGSGSHTLIHDSLKNNKNSKSSKSRDTMVYKEEQGINPPAGGRRATPALAKQRASSPLTREELLAPGGPNAAATRGWPGHHLRRGHRGGGMAVTALRVTRRPGGWRRCSGFVMRCFVYFRHFSKCVVSKTRIIEIYCLCDAWAVEGGFQGQYIAYNERKVL